METYDSEDDKDETIDGGKFIKHGRDAPAWMVTYADLMSLLFALFVLILSFSEVNDDSFKRNAGPMREAFNQNSDFQSDTPSNFTGGDGILSGVKTLQLDVPPQERLREEMLQSLRQNLARDLNSNLVEMEETTNGVILRFPSSTAFEVAGAELAQSALQTLDKIIPILARTPGQIKVGGHTDNLPISTLQYRSNWDLSAARATSVIHYFLRSGQLQKQRLTSQGYADSRPMVPNNSDANRAKNRRVEISIEIPEDSEAAQKFLETQAPKRRIWTVEEGEKEITPETEPEDLMKRRQRLYEEYKAEQEAKEAQKEAEETFAPPVSIGR